jgi:hypothetical protein
MADRPIDSFRCGNITVNVWEKFGQNGNRNLSFNIQKSYKDTQSGEWKHTGSFQRSDLPVIKDLLILASNRYLVDDKKAVPTHGDMGFSGGNDDGEVNWN